MESHLEKKAEMTPPRPALRIYACTIPWIVVSNTRLLTTKYLLTHGYNYPLHLLLAHLAAAIALETIFLVVRTFIEGPGRTWSHVKDQTDGEHRLLLALSSAATLVTTAAATMLAYQSVEHFATFSAVVTTLICVVQPWDIYPRSASLDLKFVGYLAVFTISILAVYLLDAKLTFKGVGSAALAATFATVSKVQGRWLTLHSANREPTSATSQHSTSNLISFIVALTVTSLCCLRWETPIYSPLMSSTVQAVFVLNIASSALAFRLGRSPFWMFSTGRDNEEDEENSPSPLQLWILPAWSALATTSVASTLFHVGSPMNKGQYAGCFFMMESLLAMQRQSQWSWRQRYDAVDDEAAHLSLLSSDDPSETGQDLEANLHLKKSVNWEPHTRASFVKSLRLPMIARAVVMLVLCLGLAYLDVGKSILLPKEQRTHVQNGDDASRSFELVVSYYDETVSGLGQQLKDLISMPALANFNVSMTVYNKGNSSDDVNLQEGLTRLTGHVPDIVHRPNVGKEAETYLHHIVSRWGSLADHTFFMQAYMHNFLTSQQRVNQYFGPQTGFLPLSPTETCDSFEGCTDHSTWSEESGILERIFKEANPDHELKALLLIYRGQFIASSSRMRGSGQEHYQNLLNELRDEQSYTHSKAYADRPWMPGKADSMYAPLFGYTIERMWPAILQCSELRISRRCPSLASGLIRSFVPWYTVNLEDCQCLDTL